jgi:hypothetical protein
LLESRNDRIGSTRQEPAVSGLHRGSGGRRPGSFDEAFKDALRVVGAKSPREIRVRWNAMDDSYTWSIEY